MKRHKHLKLLFLVTVCLINSISAYGDIYDFRYKVENREGINWLYCKILNDSQVAVTYEKEESLEPYSSYWGDLVIPSFVKYNNHTYFVVSIGECAFQNSKDLESVVIPSSVKSIGAAAFKNCTSLKSVDIPNGITKIESWTFRYCSSLTSLQLPKTVTQVYPDAFSQCPAMTSLTVLSKQAPELIGTSSFDLPTTCKLYIPAQGYPSYKSTWSYFSNRLNIDNYDYDENEGIPSNFIVYTSNTSSAITSASTNAKCVGYKFADGKGILAYDGDVTSIGDNAFKQQYVTTVGLPNTVTTIGSSAFYGSSLTSITLPENISSIGGSAFYNCKSLTSITLPEHISSIGSSAFYNCSKLQSFIIENPTPSTITTNSNSIPSSVAKNCDLYVPIGSASAYRSVSPWSSFKQILEPSLSLDPSTLTLTIGQTGTLTPTLVPQNNSAVISWTSSNTQVATVKNGVVTAIKDGTAVITASCNGLSATCTVTVEPIAATSVTIDKTSISITIGSTANLNATVAPSNTTYPTVLWTSSNTNIATVSNSGVVTAVGLGTATITATCGSVSATCAVTVNPIVATSVTLNKTNLSIKIGNTESLTATVAPANTTDKTITWTSSKTSVATVNSNGVVTAINVGTAIITATCGSVSATCNVTVTPQWTEVGINYTLNSDNSSYRVSGFTNKLPANVVIPAEYNGKPVTEIGAMAFMDCSVITNVVIPSSVTKIGEYAFNWCTNLTSIEVPSSVTSFGAGSFQRCSKLNSFISTNATSDKRCLIVNGVLYGFAPSGITTYSIPSTVKRINAHVFDGCKSLTSITIPTSVTSIDEGAFYACEDLREITLPSGITNISDWLFWGCIKLTSVDIQGMITSIGSNAFYDCSALTSITIPNSVTTIDDSAFNNCTGLTSIVIPKSVATIENYAFNGCSNLSSITVKINNPSSVTCGTQIFGNVKTNTCKLIVPYGRLSMYKNTTPWSDFKNIEEDLVIVSDQNFTISNDDGLDIRYHITSDNNVEVVALENSDKYIGALNIPESVNAKGIFTPGIVITWNGTWNSAPQSNAYDGLQYTCKSPGTNGSTTTRCTFSNVKSITFTVVSNGETTYDYLTVGNLDSSCSRAVYLQKFSTFGKVQTVTYTISDANEHYVEFCYSKDSSTDKSPDNATVYISAVEIFENSSVEVRDFQVTSIGSSAFSNCTQLTSVTIPNSVTKILNSAFYGCTGLTSIKCDIIDPSALSYGTYIFSNVNTSTCTLSVPRRTAALYKATSPWSSFKNIEEHYITGDANIDYSVTVADVSTTINYALSLNQGDFDVEAADINGNGKVNVADATLMTNIVLNQPAAASLSSPAKVRANAPIYQAGLSMADINMAGDRLGRLEVADGSNYVAMQMEVSVPEGVMIEAVTTDRNHSASFNYLGDNVYRLIVYSVNNSTFETSNALTIKFEESDNAVIGSVVEVHNVLVNENHNGIIEEYAIEGTQANIVNAPDVTGIDLSDAEGTIKVYVEGGELIVVAPNDCELQIVALSGMTFTRPVAQGVNRISLPKGMYIINGIKVII